MPAITVCALSRSRTYSATIESPCTRIATGSNGLLAGPLATAPSRLNLLPWHGQLIVPSATSLIKHPVWVHTAEKPL